VARHGYHTAHSNGQCQNHVNSGVHDHEFVCSCELAGIVCNDASDTTTEVDEDVCINNDCAEFNNKDPKVVEPKSFFLVFARNPALFDVNFSDS